MGRKKGMSINQLSQAWKALIIGQDAAIDKITPYLIRAQANLNAPNRPIGIFFLMGPTGTGKTKTAETLAELLHGHEKYILRIDCGEFQMEHEVAKMIGAPPGYLGHRETQPIFTQQKLNAIVSEKCPFNIILFDEIEKAHPGVWRVILGILDKAQLRLGDNTIVNFENSIIFFSSNIGAKEIGDLLEPKFGFGETIILKKVSETQQKAIEKIGLGSMSKKFPPEFSNRIDEIISYRSLNTETLTKITEIELQKIQKHIQERLGTTFFAFTYKQDTVNFLTATGTSLKYGARELKRALGRYILNPLSDDFVEGKISSGNLLLCKVVDDHIEWDISEAPLEIAVPEVVAEVVVSATTEKKVRRAKSSG